MTLKMVREKARAVGVKNYSRFRKADLIRAIQLREGNTACFQNIPDCGEFHCLWREECRNA